MPRPKTLPRVRRAPAVAAVVLFAPLLATCGRRTPEAETPPSGPSVVAPAPAPQTPALTRATLAAALDEAASAFASGAAPTGADPLVGRSFDVRLPFGCGGPLPAAPAPAPGASEEAPPGDGLARARWGPGGRTIQLTLTPADWTGSPLLSTGAEGAAWEAVEGLWMPRPWLRSDACPAVAGDPLQTAAAPASPQTAGLAAVFETGGSRVGRRNGRAYAFTIRGEGDAAPTPAPEGYRLRLAGRIVGFPGGRAIRCSAAGPDQRPVCVAAVQLDSVAFETAAGRVLSTWTSG